MLLQKINGKTTPNRETTFTVVSLLSNQKKNWNLVITWVFTVLTLALALIYERSRLQRIIPFPLNLFYLPLVFYTLYKIWRNYVNWKVQENNSYTRLLRYFIKSNNLYETDTQYFEKIDSSGKVKRESKKIIISSARLGFLENGNEIIIRAFKDANKFDDKMAELDSGLSALLGLEIDNKKDKITHTDYMFKTSRDERLIITSENQNITKNNSVNLPLNNNLNWNIQKQPHLLLAGTTGSGKTTFLNYLILEMLKMNAEIYICDPKRSDLSSLKHYIGADYVASETNSIAKLTRIVKEEMNTRFVEYKENAEKFVYGHSYVDYELNPVFIIFDELGAFRAGSDKKTFQETMANLTEIILKGREMGVFCVLSTQQPNAQNIPTELRDNLSVRLAMGNMSNEAYRMVFADGIDLQTVHDIGTGYIFLDGLGWQLPKYFEAPYLDYKSFNFIEELKKYK